MDNTRKEILLFIGKVLLMVLPVLVPLTAWYIYADPFKVIRHYDRYFDDPQKCPARVGINKGLITLTNYEERKKEGVLYNAFIFGSSISITYDAHAWAQMLDSTGHALPYHFDSSGESIRSMREKMEYLVGQGDSIRYALIVLDPIIMAGESRDVPPTINPPQLHKSWLETLKYHYIFFRAATNADFFKNWIPSRITGKPYDIARSRLFEVQPIEYDPLTNTESIPAWDAEIASNPRDFYQKYPLMPAPDTLTQSAPVLTASKTAELERIADILKSQGSDYQIIVSPNRSKITLNPEDLKRLNRVFGPSRVHDYTSSEATYLEQDTLLYDDTHYRAPFALRLLRLTYK